MKITKGEEEISLVEIDGEFLSLNELMERYPDTWKDKLKMNKSFNGKKELIKSRYREKAEQGRLPVLQRFKTVITPKEQVDHVMRETEIGEELIEAERKLLEFEIAQLMEE